MRKFRLHSWKCSKPRLLANVLKLVARYYFALIEKRVTWKRRKGALDSVQGNIAFFGMLIFAPRLISSYCQTFWRTQVSASTRWTASGKLICEIKNLKITNTSSYRRLLSMLLNCKNKTISSALLETHVAKVNLVLWNFNEGQDLLKEWFSKLITAQNISLSKCGLLYLASDAVKSAVAEIETTTLA